MRAVVVGGGIGGLAAGIALGRAGAETTVLEQAEALRAGGFGLLLGANALAALDSLGVGDAVRERSARVAAAEIRTPRDSLLTSIPYERLGWEVRGLRRAALLDVLASALPAGALRLGARCERLDEGGVVLADGRLVPGELVVGADGIHSRVRAVLHGPERLRYAGQRAWRASVVLDHPRARGRFVEVWGAGRGFGFGPCGDGGVYWYCFAAEPEDAPPPGDLRALLLERYGDWFEPIPALIEATPADVVEATLLHDRRPRRSWGSGGVTLLGDAAHPMTPNLGQGAAQALEDAAVLGACARQHESAEEIVRAYELARVRRANTVVRMSRQAGLAAGVRSRGGAALRDVVMRALPDALTVAQQRRLARFELNA